jgi:hypothetical protein
MSFFAPHWNILYLYGMSTKEIIQGIKKLPFNERLVVIELALRTLHGSADSQLENAAKALVADYKKDKDLTAFTGLDFEDFYEAR